MKNILNYAEFINENIENSYDWTEYEIELTREIFENIKNHEKISFNLIPKNQYHNALKEFMLYGKFIDRFPIKYIFEWKEMILQNIAKLNILNEINGHSSNFPYDEFMDIFDYDNDTNEEGCGEYSKWLAEKFEETNDNRYKNIYDFTNAYDFMDNEYDFDSVLPSFTNGQFVISDYGLEPLYKLGSEMVNQDIPEEIIVTINKILDVTHQRSDLAELFIEGGTKTLNYISNS